MRHILLLFAFDNLLPLMCCVGCSNSIIMVLMLKENGGFELRVDDGVTRTGTQYLHLLVVTLYLFLLVPLLD